MLVSICAINTFCISKSDSLLTFSFFSGFWSDFPSRWFDIEDAQRSDYVVISFASIQPSFR